MLNSRIGLSFLLLATSLGAVSQTAAQTDENAAALEVVIVTATRSNTDRNTMAQGVTVLDDKSIVRSDLQHSNQLFNRVSGAWISRGNGQESLVSLRSPVLTGAGGCGAFLTAEDGIGLRAPGFCNVNQLFDANLIQAGSVEVLKGPAMAVFGSNAMHGVINVTTRGAANTTPRLSLQSGSRDYYRAMLSTASDKLALNGNVTSYGGYQDASGYDQQKFTLRYDETVGDWQMTAMLAANNLNQETAGYIQDGKGAYKNDASRRVNRNPEAYRDAQSTRAYARFQRMVGDHSVTITPYWRDNRMEFLQHYLPWKSRERNAHSSLGLQASAEGSASTLSYLLGIDIDSTEGTLFEDQAEGFSPNQPAGVHYDYSVDALNSAVFGQLSQAFSDSVMLKAGARLERTKYDYQTREPAGSVCAPTASNCRFYRPESGDESFSNLSYNLAALWSLGDGTAYLRHASGFRAPQATELFRLQSGQTSTDIDSEEMSSVELGYRYQSERFATDVAIYSMDKDDVIFQDRNRQTINGAKTSHQGLEIDLSWFIRDGLRAELAANIADHQYDSDIQLLGSSGSIKGNEIDTAPTNSGSARLVLDTVLASKALTSELEFVWVGDYYIDPNNQHSYAGHELLNLRTQWQVTPAVTTTVSITNLLDTGYAERADFGFGNYRYFVGEPRSAVLGFSIAL